VREGKLNEAIALYQKAIAQNPKIYIYYHNLGEALGKLDKLDQAVTAYQKAIELKPSAAWSMFKLGEILAKQEKFEQAAQKRQRAVELCPEYAETWLQTDKPYKIGIKTSVPNLQESYIWGDYHFAQGLKRSLEKLGHKARVDCQDAWESEGLDDDVVIVLRGRHGYKPKANQINLLWLISHPDRVKNRELNLFDHILVASEVYTQKLSQQLQVPVSCMYQCTDTVQFDEVHQNDVPAAKILFVGSSRNVFRPIVKDAINTGIDLEVYGLLWEQFIPQKFIKQSHIPNELLYKYYSNCTILLNDHWETMRQEGFISNRLFDGSACGALIISDPVVGLEEVFANCIETYSIPQELREKISYYLENSQERYNKAQKAKAIVTNNHTFLQRAKQLIEIITSIQKNLKVR
jgi:glycosyltransferase involved in cell wall biosynthesis